MKIKMTETVQGSIDGVTVQELTKDQKYDTVDTPRGDRLARYHIEQGVAVSVEADPVAEPEALVPKKAK